MSAQEQQTPEGGVNARAPLQLYSRPHFFEGYVFGFRQPVLRYTVLISDGDSAQINRLGLLLGKTFDVEYTSENTSFPHAVAHYLRFWPRVILEQSEHPVFEPARQIPTPDGPPGVSTIVQPCLDHNATFSVVNFLVGAANTALKTGRELTSDIEKQLSSGLDKLQNSIKPLGLNGFNQLHFLQAAFELGIPWMRLKEKIFQLGFGSRARWLKSSITDATPSLSVALARNKFFTSDILRSNGIPVPTQSPAKSKYEAVQIANEMGFPVVVKPANLDGGKGVKANIHNADTLQKAFVSANRFSKHVLVEKHVPGRDYRIHVVNGVVHGVLERIPGGVTGNGKDTVKDLVEKQNIERATARDDRRYLYQMTIDEEAHEQLEAQNLALNSVPADGLFVRLRGACNVTGGGIPVPIPLDTVHPDNRALATRAARVLRLDVAGIDMLIPDIGKSWLESGGHICEVNAQPQMHTDMHKPMLVSMFNGTKGRIPVAVVISAEPKSDGIAPALHRALSKTVEPVGLVHGGQVRIGEQLVSREHEGSYSGARILCLDPTINAMVVSVTDEQIRQKGWPVDACDLLVVDCTHPARTEANRSYSPSGWVEFASQLRPALVLIDNRDAECLERATAVFPRTCEIRTFGQEDQGDLAAMTEAVFKNIPQTTLS